jgi:hypothetical protein
LKKIYLFGGIAGGIILLVVAGIIAVFFAGAGFLRENLPALIGGGTSVVSESLRIAEGFFPGAKEIARNIAPGLTENVEKILPLAEIPTKDVGGEEIAPIPRFPGLIRISYASAGQKKTVTYKGKAEFKAATDFYRKEMAALGFKEMVLRASAEEEAYQYRKEKQDLEFRFKKLPNIYKELTELTIREL